MPNWDMEIYIASAGVELTISWDSEEDYQRGRKFVEKMDVSCGPPGQSGERPEFFYLQNEEQLRALLNFRKSLGAIRNR